MYVRTDIVQDQVVKMTTWFNLYSMTDWLSELYEDEVVGFILNPTTLEC